MDKYIKNSNDLVSHWMILMNAYTGVTMINDKIGIFRSVIIKNNEEKTDDLIEVENLYAEKVKLINSEKKIFTDKNLFNFFYCPVIYNLFPNARIIHCARNPLDNILSIYRTNFLNQSFSSSLNDITELYLYQMKLMHEYKNKFLSLIHI